MQKSITQIGREEDGNGGLVGRSIVGVREYIRENQLKPGDTLPSESAFAEKLNVSRTVTREAFRALAALGILEVGNGRKARVSAPDASPLSMIIDHTVYTKQLSYQQVLDVRRTLELRTASLAALRRSDTQATALFDLVTRMFATIEQPDELMELDIEFHELIAIASGNSLYSIIVNSFRVITQQTWHIGWRSRGTEENRMENIRCHERIATAIMAQNPVRVDFHPEVTRVAA